MNTDSNEVIVLVIIVIVLTVIAVLAMGYGIIIFPAHSYTMLGQ